MGSYRRTTPQKNEMCLVGQTDVQNIVELGVGLTDIVVSGMERAQWREEQVPQDNSTPFSWAYARYLLETPCKSLDGL